LRTFRKPPRMEGQYEECGFISSFACFRYEGASTIPKVDLRIEEKAPRIRTDCIISDTLENSDGEK
jgi:hypothetical protein